MGILNKVGSEGLYSSEPPYYAYGAPQVPLQPAQPPQEMAMAQPIKRLAKGGSSSTAQQLESLRSSAGLQEEDMQDLDRLQDVGAPDSELGDAASDDPFVQGEGDGRDDTVNALLSDGEYVFDAETVALLGNGSSKAGAAQLDALRERIRAHKGAALAKGDISPDAKSAEQYLEEK